MDDKEPGYDVFTIILICLIVIFGIVIIYFLWKYGLQVRDSAPNI